MDFLQDYAIILYLQIVPVSACELCGDQTELDTVSISAATRRVLRPPDIQAAAHQTHTSSQTTNPPARHKLNLPSHTNTTNTVVSSFVFRSRFWGRRTILSNKENISAKKQSNRPSTWGYSSHPIVFDQARSSWDEYHWQ